MSTLNLKIQDEIAFIEFDQPDSKVNVLNTSAMQELDSILGQLAGGAHPDVKALLITSKKDGIFIAGADIKEIEVINTVAEAKEKAEKGKEILFKLAELKLVTMAVINGACLGGGLELALACNYRVAGLSNKIKIGLPEVKLGIIPGFGGTQRLPRVIGLTKAVSMILGGEVVSGSNALRLGLVDRLFSDARIVEEAVDFVREILEGRGRPKKKQKREIISLFLEETHLGRNILFDQAKKNVLKKTKGFYPAPLKAIDVLWRTYGMDIRKGSVIESEVFGELAITDISKNLIKVFYLNEEFKKIPWVGPDCKPAEIKKCGIVGAGVMGGGIAQLLSFYDIPTRVKDINFESLKTALKTAKSLFDYSLKKRKLKQAQVDFKLGLISPTVTYQGFENADFVIEAVVEDINIKQKVFKEISQITRSDTVLASNTSSLPIIKMAEVATSPERMVGLHFFNPVHRMPLVEVIRSSKSSDKSIATAIAFARKIGKVVIVVKDVPGFLINRILLSYMNEAGFLIEEGLRMEKIDEVALKFGMPMGPIELIDEVGVDVGYKVAKILEEAYGSRMRVAAILKKAKEKGLLGKKSKRGFYIHKGKEKIPNAEIGHLLEASGQCNVSDETALKRMVYIMVNEATRCLEEGVVDRPETIDIGMIMGTGFPPFRAGLLRYADSVGVDHIVRDLRNLEKLPNGERFKPCDRLILMTEKKAKFY
ncbi:MAG: hypothetical protein A3G33_05970 [Omnitrophica bacterium RIFCSPLOWO2_12_FULL_44_17]|uniref:enoyl-CoA hydratase n=1 Tax=Candidatus Danuiimicrobium aquiferis TaxID=1801832 RepID=A0A1G1L2F0_9BACT|nr:MAG: hypothetical protein A3B72_06200 [Omnitrophica bacterium RIFCSPHIGHO2_02_FULL_45_28]OGW89473.1 MAG: hypothetical protein A3E74_08515 [Omnitrophica bacterium RIFCSPHIGHO2_12_FULL_44_12]OGW99335.1 MAG: hypothetical protein A3G33_05970 [Omnitrophica bacterium RIFCSPLOWO2_12_FULL_44_17]